MELKRSINNKNFLYCFTAVVLCFVLGYILLVSLDKVDNVTIKQLFESIYSVITQFGMMLFSIIVIYSFSVDYKEKNILFYRMLGINEVRYFLSKLLVMIFWFSISLLTMTIFICILYGDFSELWVMLCYSENALIYEILISALIAFLFKNMLAAYCINLSFWISSIVISTTFGKLSFLAYFDSSNILSHKLSKYWITGNAEYLSILNSFMYNLILFCIVLCFVWIFRKRWLRNGLS